MAESNILESNNVQRIANQDAKQKYRTLDDLSVTLRLSADGWHVEYHPEPGMNGGGPHYVLNS